MGFGEGLLLAVRSVGGQQSLLESVAAIPARVVRATEEQNRCQYSDLRCSAAPSPSPTRSKASAFLGEVGTLGSSGEGDELARSLHPADLVACSLSSSAHLKEISLSHL